MLLHDLGSNLDTEEPAVNFVIGAVLHDNIPWEIKFKPCCWATGVIKLNCGNLSSFISKPQMPGLPVQSEHTPQKLEKLK